MNDVTGVVLLAQPVADVVHLIGREVGHSTHPDAEAPCGQHRWKSRQHAIATQYLLRCCAADEEDVQCGIVVQELYAACAVVGERQFAVVAGMVETAIHPAAHIERNVLVAAAVVDTLPVLVLQLEGLSAQIHLAEALTRTDKAFVRFTAEADGGALRCRDRTSGYEAQGEGIVAGR